MIQVFHSLGTELPGEAGMAKLVRVQVLDAA